MGGEDSAVEAAEEKWDPVETNLETVQAVKKSRTSVKTEIVINQPLLLEAVVQTEDTVPDLSAEPEVADSKITKMAAIEMMTSTLTREVHPVDVGEVAAADLEAVVCEAAAVDSVEDSAEAAAAEVSVEAVADSEEASEAEEAVVGVVAEAVEVTLMVKAARKLQNNQKFKLQEQKNKDGLELLPVLGQRGRLRDNKPLEDFDQRSLPPCRRGKTTAPWWEQPGGAVSSGWRAAGQRGSRRCRQRTRRDRPGLHSWDGPSPGGGRRRGRQVLRRGSTPAQLTQFQSRRRNP